MFPPWAPFFMRSSGTSHCCAEQARLRDEEHGEAATAGGDMAWGLTPALWMADALSGN
ncbi:MAG: hypothetical protein QOI27_1262 [Gaiellaceae bacterium]|nr:hypothetical protein [Gaiellaceae bacterium]